MTEKLFSVPLHLGSTQCGYDVITCRKVGPNLVDHNDHGKYATTQEYALLCGYKKIRGVSAVIENGREYYVLTVSKEG